MLIWSYKPQDSPSAPSAADHRRLQPAASAAAPVDRVLAFLPIETAHGEAGPALGGKVHLVGRDQAVEVRRTVQRGRKFLPLRAAATAFAQAPPARDPGAGELVDIAAAALALQGIAGRIRQRRLCRGDACRQRSDQCLQRAEVARHREYRISHCRSRRPRRCARALHRSG